MFRATPAIRSALRRLLLDPAIVETGVEVEIADGVHQEIARMGFAAGALPLYFELGSVRGYRAQLRVRFRGTRDSYRLEAAIGVLPVLLGRAYSPPMRAVTWPADMPTSRHVTAGRSAPAAATSRKLVQSPRSSSVTNPDDSHASAIESATASQAKRP